MSAADERARRRGYRAPPVYYPDLASVHERPRFTLTTVAYHETLPGHLLQLRRQADAAPTPAQVRSAPGYAEGWAIYAESLADRMGLLSPVEQVGFCQSAAVPPRPRRRRHRPSLARLGPGPRAAFPRGDCGVRAVLPLRAGGGPLRRRAGRICRRCGGGADADRSRGPPWRSARLSRSGAEHAGLCRSRRCARSPERSGEQAALGAPGPEDLLPAFDALAARQAQAEAVAAVGEKVGLDRHLRASSAERSRRVLATGTDGSSSAWRRKVGGDSAADVKVRRMGPLQLGVACSPTKFLRDPACAAGASSTRPDRSARRRGAGG